ncbi:uncharacterized protein LOC126750480 [Anthonomus grandis grandis]|uniref:uncharacterized protein LOC126750480 n=1 Tax=Anthonomus grandis grandis TaxID=2921223 RepID=UPI0021659FC5|nr:uncharacterized protein LOC126750480 [Anthonomus grandis grandis]XP_050316071.1 uncharacterized protein LOC126750480 [Anthonomus grandis grandis]
MFGTPQRNGLLDSCLDSCVANEIKTEEQLEEHLKLIKESLEKEQENDTEFNIEKERENETQFHMETELDIEVENNTNEGRLVNGNVDMMNCFVCDNMYVPRNKCIECNESLLMACATDWDLPLCKLYGNKKATDTERRGCKRGLEQQADKMLNQSQSKFPPVNVGDNVLINVPEVDRGRLAPRNVLSVIMEKTDQGLYVLGTKNGKLTRLYSRNEFQLSPSLFLSLSEVAVDSSVNVRQEAMLSSGSKQGPNILLNVTVSKVVKLKHVHV